MGRKPIFKKPMTSAQYKRRWRAKVKRIAKAAKQEQRRIAREAAAAENSKSRATPDGTT
jgi:hypothetical protein